MFKYELEKIQSVRDNHIIIRFKGTNFMQEFNTKIYDTDEKILLYVKQYIIDNLVVKIVN